MKNNELTLTNQKKSKKFNIVIALVSVVFIAVIAGIIYYYTVVYNSDKNVIVRSLIKDGYECGKQVCTINEDGIKYSYDAKNELLSAFAPTYEFIMEEKSYTYNDLKKGNYCAYTTRNFTKGMEVDKTFTYNSPCDDYFDNVNKILELYGKIQNLKK